MNRRFIVILRPSTEASPILPALRLAEEVWTGAHGRLLDMHLDAAGLDVLPGVSGVEVECSEDELRADPSVLVYEAMP